MYISNLIVITPSENSPFSTENSNHKETFSLYNYTRDQLITMSDKLKDSKYCILPFHTIKQNKRTGTKQMQSKKTQQ